MLTGSVELREMQASFLSVIDVKQMQLNENLQSQNCEVHHSLDYSFMGLFYGMIHIIA